MPDYDHPDAPPAKDNPIPHRECRGDGCTICGGSGLVPAWIYED